MRRRSRPTWPEYRPFDLPGLSAREAASLLISHSALTWQEVQLLESIADEEGDEPERDDIRPSDARRLLAYWRGPIPGLRLMPLRHWGRRSWVRGGAPYDPNQRAALVDSYHNPFGGIAS